MKFIVKSKSQVFGGLYFRKSWPNSMEWTSFDMAAWCFDSRDSAIDMMESLGVWKYEIIPSP